MMSGFKLEPLVDEPYQVTKSIFTGDRSLGPERSPEYAVS